MQSQRHSRIAGYVMKLSLLQLILSMLLTSLSYALPVSAQDLLKRPVTLTVEKQPLGEILSLLERAADVRFVYSPQIVRAKKKLSISVRNERLDMVLDKLLGQFTIYWQVVGGQIILKKGVADRSSLEAPALQLAMLNPAADHPITGKVNDGSTNKTLPGVSIVLKGTSLGTTSDADGNFSLAVPDDGVGTTLIFSFIGYTRQEVAVGNKTVVDVTLIPTTQELNQVVVIGYGQQARRYVTGAISQVKSAELTRYSGSSGFAQQLAGKAAGITVNEASAQPGTDPQIVIRGVGTLTAGKSPLVVVDGFPLTEGSSLNSVNPQDIESIQVLKDPASASIYGSRAANGVIIIATKKGKADKLSVSFDAYTGIQQRADNVKLLDAYDFAQYSTEARDWGYISKNSTGRSITDDRATRVSKGASLRELRLNYIQPYLDRQPGLTNTNWLNEIFTAAPINNYNLAFSGGSAKAVYYISGNYFNQKGIVLQTGYERYSSTIKVDAKLSERINVGVSVNPSYSKQNYFVNDGGTSNDPLRSATLMYPFFSAYNPDGSLAIGQEIRANTPEDGALQENPVAYQKKIKNNLNLFRTFGNAYFSWKPMANLTLKTVLGGDVRSSFNDYYNPSDVGAYRTLAPKPALASETDNTIVNYLSENTADYAKTVGNHEVDVLVGYTFQKESSANTAITGTGFQDDKVPNIGGASSFAVLASRYVWTQISYLSRIQYSYKNRYLVSIAARRDGSSRFGSSSKWGNFPSVSLGWIMNEEPFFPKSDLITFAKLRATWGKTGNNQIGSYTSRALVTQDNYVYGTALATGYATTSSPNPNLSWETNTATNLGLDLTFWNRLNLTANYYHTITSNLLLNVPVPQQSGYATSTQNIGKVKNTGFEVELSANLKLGPVTWDVGANAATNRNEVLALAPGQQQILTGTNSAFRTRVGGPIAELYGYNIIGVYKTQDQLTSTPRLAGTLMGDYMVEDVNKDGVIDQNDKIGFGTYSPKLTYGFTSSFSYKRIDLSFALTGIAGRKIYDNTLLNLESGEAFQNADQYYFDHRYNPTTNPDGFFAQPNAGNVSAARSNTKASSIYFSDASYLRMRNLQLAYNLPNPLVNRVKGMRVRVYATVNNLFTLTKFRGFNPDATTTDALTSGYSVGNYPVARSFIVGINLNF